MSWRNIPQPLRGNITKALGEAVSKGEIDDVESAMNAIEIAYTLMIAESVPPKDGQFLVPGDLERIADMSEDEAFLERFERNEELDLWVHAAGTCVGKSCCIHNPSDHPLKDAPRNWRSDRGLMERICPHGVGHPDPDDLAYHRFVEASSDDEEDEHYWRGVHGCCHERCCSTST